MDNYFNSTSMVQTIWKWKWHIVIITVVAAILGAIFSGSRFITPMYKSEATLYPSNVSAYSDETFTEQMLQIMQSNEIMDSVVIKFDLMRHYKIDKGYKYWKTALIDEYRTNVSISRTPYDAVLIKVLDKDPEIACAMVNEIIRLYNYKVGKLHKSKRLEIINMYKQTLNEKQMFIDSLKRKMSELSSKYGLLDYEYQSKEVTRGMLRTDGGTKVKEDAVDTLLINMEKYGSDMLALKNLIQRESETYSNTKFDYEQHLRFYKSDMTFSNVISEPFVSDKKAYPVRWVVVALCGLAACFITILVIYIIEGKKNLLK